MSITEDIRNAIKSRVRICYETADENSHGSEACIICKNDCPAEGKLYLYVKGEGRLCPSCAERFVPEKYNSLQDYKNRDLEELISNAEALSPSLTPAEWKDVKNNIDALLEISEDLSKGIARGIIEAPSGHIGLIYLAKDIVKPEKRDNESEKDYELRVKTFRIQKLHEKIRAQTVERISLLRRYFDKLGLP